MVHEGPKAAEAADRLARPITIEERKLASAHPWADELAGFEHWGLLGGVHAVERADFAELRESGVREIVYFCDNDEPGLLVPKPFSRRWGQKFRVIKLDRRWPPGWDIADPMPSQLFDDSVPTEERPSLRGLMRPATWATKMGVASGKKGRPAHKLNEAFASDWYHVTKPSVYVPRDFPEKKYDKREFDAETRPFSDVAETSRLFDADDKTHAAGLEYLPDKLPGLISLNHNTGLVLNTHVPTKIVPIKGDIAPFLDYLEGLLPVEEERHEVMRWVATLIARPDIRMEFALLMISETQGVGKTTLAEKILTPLLGPWNVSFPSEKGGGG